MKKNLLLSLLISASIYTTNAQVTSCTVSPILQSFYDKDVHHLALQRVYQQATVDTNSIEIPKNYLDTIWQGLAAIYNLTGVIQRDSVFDKYCIHHEVSDVLFHNILITVDPNYPWTQNWKNNFTKTGIPSLDSLLSVYGYTIASYDSWLNFATLTTTKHINEKPLCRLINKYAGVTYAEPESNYWDGNKIQYKRNGNDRIYDFILGYGDCPAGCEGKYIFRFNVDSACTAHFLWQMDSSLTHPSWGKPKPDNCNITLNNNVKNQNNLPRIYPNPAETFLNIEMNEGVTHFCVYNSFGQLLDVGIFTRNTRLSIELLPKGIYLLRLLNFSGEYVFNYQFIKQ